MAKEMVREICNLTESRLQVCFAGLELANFSFGPLMSLCEAFMNSSQKKRQAVKRLVGWDGCPECCGRNLCFCHKVPFPVTVILGQC
jgi:hypothetical protein